MIQFLRRLLFLPEESSTFAVRADRLHFSILVPTIFGALVIGAVGLYFLVRYRRRPGQEATPLVEAPLWLEGLFAAVPLAMFLAWFFVGFRDFVWASSPPRNALDVYVTGKEWMWKFSYPQGASSLGVLYVPAGQPVRLLLTSRDVIHSFFVPDFRLKKDALPGRYTETWFEAPRPGKHEVLCAEYCGLDHSQMRAEVVVLSPADFAAWRGRETTPVPHEPLAARGEVVAAQLGCLECHTLDGTPHIGPSWKGMFGRDELLSDGQRVRVDEAYLTESMMEPNLKLVAGFLPVMPSFLGRLDPAQTAALVEFIKSLRLPEATPTEKPAYGPLR